MKPQPRKPTLRPQATNTVRLSGGAIESHAVIDGPAGTHLTRCGVQPVDRRRAVAVVGVVLGLGRREPRERVGFYGLELAV